MFSPEVINLSTVNELVNVDHTITYVVADPLGIGPGTSYDVVITPIDINKTINITENRIHGYFSDSFDNEIQYRTKDDRFLTVDKFSEIDEDIMYGIYLFKADTRRTIVYQFLAEANGQSKIYTITVQNDWTLNRNTLLEYLNEG